MSSDAVEREVQDAEEFFECKVDQGSREHIKFLVKVGDARARHLVCVWKLGVLDGETGEIKRKIDEIKRKMNALSRSSRPVVGDAAESTRTGGNNGNHS